MRLIRKQNIIAAALVGVLTFTTAIAQSADPLPAWNDSKAKQSIGDFLRRVAIPKGFCAARRTHRQTVRKLIGQKSRRGVTMSLGAHCCWNR